MTKRPNECVINDVKLKNNNVGPVIVTFEHGCIDGDKAQRLKLNMYSNHGNLEVGAVADGGDILYQGCCNNKFPSRTLILIKKKHSRKVVIHEADNVILSPHLESSSVKASEPQEKKAASLALSRVFGSKKSKRVADQRERMSLNVDAVKHKGTLLINDVQVDSEVLSNSQDNSLEQLLPPCNRSALSISHAYPLSGILNEDELHSLEIAASKIAEGALPSPKLSPFCDHLATQIKSDCLKSLGLLLYVQSLIEFCCVFNNKVLSRRKVISPYSDLVWDRILRDFMSSGLHESRSTLMEDKAVAYIIILNFHIGSEICDVNSLAKSLSNRNLNVSRIKYIASVVGAVKHSNLDDFIRLVFPLRPLPLPQKSPRSRQKK